MSPSSTSISERRPLAAVCRRALLFLAPVLLLLGFCELVFWRARECWPPGWVINAFQRDPRTLYGPRFFAQAIEEIKPAMIRANRPEIIALGSSRVTQFRAPMFAPLEREFFNAGLLVTSAPEFLSFTELFLQGKLPAPRVLILGLDPWWIKQRTVPDLFDRWHDYAPQASGPVTGAAHLEALRRMIGSRQIPWKILRPGALEAGPDGALAIGLGALDGNCYRGDGSVRQTDHTRDYLRAPGFRDRERPPIIDRIRQGIGQFSASEGVDWVRADRIVARLVELKAAGIEVYAFLPPLSTEADAAFRASPALAKWAAEYHGEFLRRVNAAGVLCVDVASPATYGLSDDFMIDGFHPGDVLATFILEDLVRHAPPGSVLSGLDLARLKQLRSDPRVTPISLDPPPAL